MVTLPSSCHVCVQARRGNAALVYELLRHKADPSALDANGLAPIFAAARRRRLRSCGTVEPPMENGENHGKTMGKPIGNRGLAIYNLFSRSC